MASAPSRARTPGRKTERMPRYANYFSVPPIVLGRMLAILFLGSIAVIYFVSEGLGLIPPIFAEAQISAEERRALAKHNGEVKRLIAAREARASAVRAADLADIAVQTARDAPSRPVDATPPSTAAEPSAALVGATE